MAALPEPDPLGLLDRLGLGAGHGLTRLQPPDAPEPWQGQQHAPADEAVAVGRHVERGGAFGGHRLRVWPAVVDQAAVGDVAERVHVGVAVAVEGQADVVRGKRHPAGADVDVMALDHVMGDRAGVVRPGRRVHRYRHRRAPTGPDCCGRRPHGVRGDVIQRAERVVGSPAAPVLDRLEDLVQLWHRDRSGRGQLRHCLARLLSSGWSWPRVAVEYWSYAACGLTDWCTTELTAPIIAIGSLLWKMFRPMSTPAAPSSMAR